ncbi:hypothetical protein BsIDN1_41790 [Bacillus safensis]|uniref:Peptidase M20 dimerisation domain-containing protein n=1 Tax=Bacillus safensis TaxID=561879 RepID=A0A5S9MCE5_BACIA|nr:hypothetical protein BsIDN1_41790 [Bacillus safensis]
MEAQVAKMKEAFEKTAKEMGGSADVQIDIMYPGFKFSRRSSRRSGEKKAAAKNGRPSELQTSGGGSDANVIAGNGVPTVNLAVGYEDIHTKKKKKCRLKN